ncbi:MAG TPA: DnaJ family domain-containing protein [Acidimicrobiia bacterium]|jgi:hypothetical protein
MTSEDGVEPIGPTSGSAVEDSILRAIAQGDFDQLPGAGKPIPGRGVADPPGWWAQRLLDDERRRRTRAREDALLEAELSAIWMLEIEAEARAAAEDLARRVTSINAARLAEDAFPTPEPDQVMAEWRAMSAARRARP